MAKQEPQLLLNSLTQQSAEITHAMVAVELGHDASGFVATVVRKNRQIHKSGEVNISAYFPVEVKASLRMVQAKTGNSVKDCLAEALRALFRKYNVPVSIESGEDH
jgi:hypothetical protein